MVLRTRHHLARKVGDFKMVKVKPGQKAPTSGQYQVVGGKDEITLIKDKVVPPNNSGTGKQEFILVDKTK